MKMSMLHQLFLLFLLLLSDFDHFVGAQGIGVTIKRECNTPPAPKDIVALCRKINAKRVRLYDAYKDRDLLEAFQAETEKIQITVGVSNEDVMSIAVGDESVAIGWLNNNILPFVNDVSFRCIVVGQSLARVGTQVDGIELANSTYQALSQLHKAQASLSLMIPMGVEVNHDLLVANQTLVPSDGEFNPNFAPILFSIFDVLYINNGVLLVDLYPVTRYYTEPYDYQNLSLEFLLMGKTGDGELTDDGLPYHNIYESVIELFYWAMEKVEMKGIKVMIGETGWPSDVQTQLANAEYSAKYTNNLVDRLNSDKGTPRRSWPTKTFIQTLYVQDKVKPGGDGFGLFFTNGSSANPYINFSRF
ncbi:Glucan endo-1,3-beta-glucosidase, acidic isoform PR-Q' [Linum grandiflorum]